jgi:hypothetical protein
MHITELRTLCGRPCRIRSECGGHACSCRMMPRRAHERHARELVPARTPRRRASLCHVLPGRDQSHCTLHCTLDLLAGCQELGGRAVSTRVYPSTGAVDSGRWADHRVSKSRSS